MNPVLLLTLLQSLPTVIGFVETVFGGKTGVSTDKHAAAVGLLQAIVPGLEDALGANQTIRTVVDGLIKVGVSLMQANGTMPAAAAAAPVAVAAPIEQPMG